jgi:hypothetical protein
MDRDTPKLTEIPRDPGQLCSLCKSIAPFHLPSEEEDGMAHHETLEALEESAETCTLCYLLYYAAGCSLVALKGLKSTQTFTLPSGRETFLVEQSKLYLGGGLKVQYHECGTRVIGNNPEIDDRLPESVRPKSVFPNGCTPDDAHGKVVRPWLFGSWWKHPISNRALLIGLGVRLGTSPSFEDGVNCNQDEVVTHGTFLRFRTDYGMHHPSYKHFSRH